MNSIINVVFYSQSYPRNGCNSNKAHPTSAASTGTMAITRQMATTAYTPQDTVRTEEK